MPKSGPLAPNVHAAALRPGRDVLEHAIDLELVQGVLANQDAAFERFVGRMRVLPRILAVLNARLGKPLDEHDLADLAQDTLILLWRKLTTFSGTASIETWVFGVARLEFMNAVRKRRRRVAGAESVDAECLPAPANAGESRLDFEKLHLALCALDPQEAAVIRLKSFEDLTFEAIGARLLISANTAKTRYYRGMRQLHVQLRPHF